MVDVEKWEARINSMLSEKPTGASAASTQMWHQTANTTVELIEEWNKKVSNREIDDGKSEFAIWKEGGYKFEGMRHRVSKKPHGICRRTHEIDGIKEGLWHEGRREGLHKEWFGDDGENYFYLELYSNGGRLSYYYVRDDWSLYHRSGDISYHDRFENLIS